QCGTQQTLVDTRLIYPIPSGGAVYFERNNATWKEITSDLLGPFGYTFPDPTVCYIRKFRLRALYYDQNAGGSYYLEVKIDANNSSAIFRLPTIASGGGNAQAFSDWYQFGQGTAAEINKGHGRLSARFVSSAPYNNNAAIYYITLEAHDFRR
ncbi:unnamed protein product, partial [Didymodactylos carnosus]